MTITAGGRTPDSAATVAAVSSVASTTRSRSVVPLSMMATRVDASRPCSTSADAMARLPLPPLQHLLDASRRVVVLEDINDHTNIGAIFRAAAALDMDAILLAPRCADPLYRRSVKVSMGAVFAVPYTRLDDWYGAPQRLRGAGFRMLALTPDPGAIPIEALDTQGLERVALLFGAEGAGLSKRWMSSADLRVRIPMAREVDSLNVAAAAAVAFYALTHGGIL